MRKNGILRRFIEKMPGRRVIDTVSAIRTFFEHEFLVSVLFETQKKERTSTRKEHIERQRALFDLIKSLRLRPAVQNNTHKINALLNAIENLL